jgi:DNA-binding CsgD family transcriptional regulator
MTEARLLELDALADPGEPPLDRAAALLTASARAVAGTTAGATIWRDGSLRALPGLEADALLVVGSAVTDLARTHLDDGQAFATFLWPRPDVDAGDEHVRVTVLASAAAETGAALLGAVVLAPAAELQGLTPRELEVLGLVVEGLSNQQIARVLVVSPRTVATHLEHLLAKLGSPSRTLAAVRAQRLGLYVPRPPQGTFDATA